MTDDARDPNFWEDGSPVARPTPDDEPQLRPDPAIDVWARSQMSKLQARVETLEKLLMAGSIIEPDGDTFDLTQWQQELTHAFNATEWAEDNNEDEEDSF